MKKHSKQTLIAIITVMMCIIGTLSVMSYASAQDVLEEEEIVVSAQVGQTLAIEIYTKDTDTTSINFGTLQLQDVASTTSADNCASYGGECYPITIENSGNSVIDVYVGVDTSKEGWLWDFVGADDSYLIKCTNTDPDPLQGCYDFLDNPTLDYAPIQEYKSGDEERDNKIINDMNPKVEGNDNHIAKLDIEIKVPLGESPAAKTSTIKVVAYVFDYVPAPL